jgi:CheY-specific phosphatase CheX
LAELADLSGAGGSLPAVAEDELLAALRSAMQSVFETMVDLQAAGRGLVPVSDLDPALGATLELGAEVAFSGPVNGWILLRSSAEGARDIARGLLTLDEDCEVAADDAADALGECANMVTGMVKTSMLDPRGHATISCPLLHVGAPAQRSAHQAGSLAYRLTKGLVAAELWLASAAH